MKPLVGLELTPDQAEGVRIYRDWVQVHRHEGHLRRWYAIIDREYPKLDPEARGSLAETMFRKARADERNATLAAQRAAREESL
jgi:hypothetical protein